MGFLRFLLLCILASGFAVIPAQEPPVNLARSAQAVASESFSAAFTPDKAIDGDPNTRWSGISGHNEGVWYQLRWAAPVTISQILVRQYQRYAEEWDLQTWDESGEKWVTRKHFGKKGERLPLVVLAQIEPTVTSGIRIAEITHGPSFTEVEVYADARAFPPVMNVASDLRGHFIGMVTDSIGAQPAADVNVTFAGSKGNVPWKFEAKTDAHGLFTIPMCADQKGPIEVATSNGIKQQLDPVDYQYGLTPTNFGSKGESLDGKWKFMPNPPADFWKAGFDDSKWREIPVPAHWEMQGFKSPEGVGGYRRTFPVAAGSGRMKLRFDGVYSGAEVWVNGTHLATHEGGFTPFEMDVTDVVRPGQNVVAVRVKEHTNTSENLDKMSQYADFALAGIIRKVTLFRVPEAHISHLETATHFDAKTGAAEFTMTPFLADETAKPSPGDAKCELKATLRSAKGEAVSTTGSFEPLGPVASVASYSAPTKLTVPHPMAWTAETPNLYTLELEVKRGDATIQRLVQRVGLRETSIVGTELRINNVPVKIRGTAHHDQDPLMGRAVTVERSRQDLEMMKDANLNSLRTSHYPPIPELIDIADELGLYVEDEADFCWVGVSDDLRNTPHILQLTAELIERDRNHPSVFEWSICNESEYGFGFERSHEWVRKTDPSRPTSAATTADLEIATLHNPIAISRIHANEHLDKPLLFDESFCIYQGIFGDVAEMWVDPGMRDYYAEPLPAVYRAFMDSKVTQGSQIWAWSDDIFAVPGRGLEYGRGTTQSHFLENEYKLPGRGLVGDAPWGVVDGWRREKPEFWTVKKLHSPVKIAEAPVPLPSGGTIEVPVENQYDFLNLSHLIVTAKVGAVVAPVQVDVPAHHTGVVHVTPAGPLHNGETLELTFESGPGKLVDAYRLTLGRVETTPEPAPSTSKLAVNESSELGGNMVVISGHGFDLLFDKDGGFLKSAIVDDSPLSWNSPPSTSCQPMLQPNPYRFAPHGR